MGVKMCPRCHIEYTSEDLTDYFSRCAQRKDGLQCWCKDCAKAANAQSKLARARRLKALLIGAVGNARRFFPPRVRMRVDGALLKQQEVWVLLDSGDVQRFNVPNATSTAYDNWAEWMRGREVEWEVL